MQPLPNIPKIRRRAFLPRAAFALLSLATLTSGCAPADKRTVRVAVIDTSSSTAKPAIRALYAGSLETVIASCRGGDRFVAYPVTSNSQASSFRTVSVQFPSYQPLTQNEDQFKQEQERARAAATGGVRQLLRNTGSGRGTDLLFAFQEAASVFNGDGSRGVAEKDFIVLTDGFQQTRTLDLLQVGLTDAAIAAEIGVLKKDGYLPNLSGVKVWMVGCGADPKGGVGPEKLEQVRRFWLAFFKACGADLTPERYGSTLQNYER